MTNSKHKTMSTEDTSNNECKKRKPRNGGQFSHLDAVEEVLNGNSRRTPMHYEEIAKRALDAGLIVSGAKNPAQSLYSAVCKDVKKGNSRFRIDGRTGKISLVAWQGADVLQSIDEHNESVRKRICSLLEGMSGRQFEKFVADILLPGMGFEDCSATQLSHDKGIDARGRFAIMDTVYVNVGVQVKGGKARKISPKDIQALRGALNPQEQGLFITTGKFTGEAQEEAEVSDGTKSHISLIDGERLVDILVELAMSGGDAGIQIEARQMLILDASFFKDYGKAESAQG